MSKKKSSKHNPKGSLVAALDVGSSKVACFIGRVLDDSGQFEVLGVGHQASEGVKNGTIVDLDTAEVSIRRCVHAAEQMAADVMKGYPLQEVVVNLPGVHALSQMREASVQIGGQEITDNDVRRALAKAQEDMVGIDQELVHTVPVEFMIDGQKGIREPRGMFGQEMTVDIHLVTGGQSMLRNMATCIERSHLDISAFCVSAYAAGLASLVEDEMDLGCTVIDMGGGVTSFAVFHGGAMIYSDAIPLGGKHVTGDIAQGLTTSISDAERIKVLFGNAMASGMDDNEVIDVPRVGEGDAGGHQVQRSLLVGIIQPRIEEIFELVRARLNDSGLGPALGRRVVLTGGASQLAGLRDMGQYILDKQVRLGRPIRLSGLPDSVSGPGFSTTAGLLTYMAERKEEMPAEIMSHAPPESLWERTKQWLHDNW